MLHTLLAIVLGWLAVVILFFLGRLTRRLTKGSQVPERSVVAQYLLAHRSPPRQLSDIADNADDGFFEQSRQLSKMRGEFNDL